MKKFVYYAEKSLLDVNSIRVLELGTPDDPETKVHIAAPDEKLKILWVDPVRRPIEYRPELGCAVWLERTVEGLIPFTPLLLINVAHLTRFVLEGPESENNRFRLMLWFDNNSNSSNIVFESTDSAGALISNFLNKIEKARF